MLAQVIAMPLSESDANAKALLSSDPYERARQLQNNPSAQYYDHQGQDWSSGTSGSTPSIMTHSAPRTWKPFLIVAPIIALIWLLGYGMWGSPSAKAPVQIQTQHNPIEREAAHKASAEMTSLARFLDAEFSYAKDGGASAVMTELSELAKKIPELKIEGDIANFKRSYTQAISHIKDGTPTRFSSVRDITEEGTYEALLTGHARGSAITYSSLTYLGFIAESLRSEPQSETMMTTMPNLKRVWPRLKEIKAESRFAIFGVTSPPSKK
jgi:hypothetical protein